MTLTETNKILAILAVVYKTLNDSDAKARSNLWAMMFADEAYELVNAAVQVYIASDTKGFPPTIGKIKQLCQELNEGPAISEAEAVSLILKATKNGIYGAEEEFEKLPPACQQIVVSPERLRDWALLDAGEVNTVIASNLRRAYVSTQAQSENLLPEKTMLRLKGEK